ncbi:MAG TPA: LD-carboxypeptidase [bacterium]|nr:LD-carboxypeptidase [Chlamydiota bacterium]HOE26559.1 LD-carboxypeptidase [bacterium]HQM51675.1 LD-carboxypeptidase [bacterium]
MTSAITPPPLGAGDTVGIAAPASPFDRECFLRGVRLLEEAGHRTLFEEGIFSRDRYLAGSDRRRAGELSRLFADQDVKAVFCARGGYGSQRLLPLLDPKLFRGNPKIFVGYSDLTAVHAFLGTACGLVTFHGPLVTEMGRMEPPAFRALLAQLGRTAPWGEVAAGLETLRGGAAEGPLAGGSLTVFCALLGTPYAAETAGRILLLEDRGEKPYEIDRLFSSLRFSGALDEARGLLLGRFVPPAGWKEGAERYGEEVRRIALEATEESGCPVLAGFPAGHFDGSILFPLGARASLDGTRGTVTLTEPCLAG